MSTVTITYVPKMARYMITADYDETLVEIIKTVDHQSRSYDVETKRWFVDSHLLYGYLIPHMEEEGFHVQESYSEEYCEKAYEKGSMGHYRLILPVDLDRVAEWLREMPDKYAPTPEWKRFARRGCQLGARLLLLSPDESGNPVDVRSPQQRRRDDSLAQEIARSEALASPRESAGFDRESAGFGSYDLGISKTSNRTEWHQAKSPSGPNLATSDETVISRYIEAYRKRYETGEYPDAPAAPIYMGVIL